MWIQPIYHVTQNLPFIIYSLFTSHDVEYKKLAIYTHEWGFPYYSACSHHVMYILCGASAQRACVHFIRTYPPKNVVQKLNTAPGRLFCPWAVIACHAKNRPKTPKTPGENMQQSCHGDIMYIAVQAAASE